MQPGSAVPTISRPRAAPAPRILSSLRSLIDPLRSTRAIERWIGALPASDSGAVQKKMLDLVGRFPARSDIRPNQVEALLKVDARLEPVLTELTHEYTLNYEKGTEIE